MTLYYQQKTYNECIYFEENITCLNLIDKYFPTLQLHDLNRGISLFSKFSAPTIAFLAFWLAKKLRLSANSPNFTSYGK